MQKTGTMERLSDDSARWTLKNDTRQAVMVHLEPEGDQIHVESGSTLVVQVQGGRRPRGAPAPLEVLIKDGILTIWSQWPGSVVAVHLDGKAR